MTATNNKSTARNSSKMKTQKSTPSTNVLGQNYRYSIQITRVVAHFLRAQQGPSVSIEQLDDVATQSDAGDIVEQDSVADHRIPIKR